MRSAARRAAPTALFLLLAAGCEEPRPLPRPLQVAAAFDTLVSAGSLWPGFHPDSVPAALRHGDTTWLFRHPAPPEGFRSHPRHARVQVRAGPDSLMRANTSIELGGVRTATLLLPLSDTVSPRRRAATLVHEAFHAYQRAHHPTWAGDEASLFVYPFGDSASLALRRLETAALRRAVGSPEPERAACWALRALSWREERTRGMPGEAVAYEVGTELNEGLATYVEHRALGGTAPAELIREEGYTPAEVRRRAYDVGAAWAFLLDRLDPTWKADLVRDEASTLETLARQALHRAPPSGCGFTGEEHEAIVRAAEADRTAYLRSRGEERRAFMDREGWTVEVLAPASDPLFPSGFDPLNLHVLEGQEVLHTRWIEVGTARGSVEVIDTPALTVGAGPHPLFNGVVRIVVTGLMPPPSVSGDGGRASVEGPGVSVRFERARVVEEERTVRVITGEGG